jgi:hypothetical protein
MAGDPTMLTTFLLRFTFGMFLMLVTSWLDYQAFMLMLRRERTAGVVFLLFGAVIFPGIPMWLLATSRG